MRIDWVPASAALLVTGGLALALASIMTPSGSSSADTLRLVQHSDNRWLAVAAIYFLASAMLTLGLPAALTLVTRKGRLIGLGAAVTLAIGFIGTAGYAMVLVFFRALVVTDALREGAIDEVGSEPGLMVFLFGWVISFAVGEVLLAIALLRARLVHRAAPLLLLAHVVTILLSGVLPDAVGRFSILLLALGLAMTGIRAAAVGRSYDVVA